MAHEADHEQVDIQPVDQPDDRVDDVTRHEVRLDRHTGGCGLSFCGCDDERNDGWPRLSPPRLHRYSPENRGSSSTVTMWSSATIGPANSIAAVSAFKAPAEPSFAANILVYISQNS
jgi:hypothetical protein